MAFGTNSSKHCFATVKGSLAASMHSRTGKKYSAVKLVSRWMQASIKLPKDEWYLLGMRLHEKIWTKILHWEIKYKIDVWQPGPNILTGSVMCIL